MCISVVSRDGVTSTEHGLHKANCTATCVAMRHICLALSLLVCLSAASIYTDGGNKFGMGCYGKEVPWREQLPWALNLTGPGGRVLLFMTLSFAENGNVTSCGDCVPAAEALQACIPRTTLLLTPWIAIIEGLPKSQHNLSYSTHAVHAYRLGPLLHLNRTSVCAYLLLLL